MADKVLLISLGHDTVADVRWGQVGEAQSAFSARLDLDNADNALAAMARDSKVVVLVPARHVVLRSTEFQGKSRLATPVALAYRHESELLTDIEQMHWAVLGREQMTFGIAGVALSQMNVWLGRLNACGVRAEKMIPDVLTLPLPGQCSAVQWSGQWLIRTGKWQGMSLPALWADSKLPVKPDLCIHAEGSAPPAWESTLSEGDPLWQLADEAWRSKINLLQGKFKPPAKWPRFIPGNIAGLLLLVSCSLLASGLYHQRVAEQSELQITALYHRIQPVQPLTAFPAETIGRKIRQMQSLLNEPQLFTMLPYATEMLASWKLPRLQSLAFDGVKNELVITLFKDDIPLPPPSEDNGIYISMTEDATAGLAILTIKGSNE